MKKKLNNKEALILYYRVIRLLKKVDKDFFRLKKLKGAMGYCEWEDGIVIDYRRELIPTIVHECIHYLEPDWTESQVLYSEKRVMNTVNIEQIKNILKLFLDCI
jgi:hypothetical protein